MTLWGHSANYLGKRHSLDDHLRGTGRRAGQNARPFRAGELAHHLGVLHDVGKGACDWQGGLLRAERTGGRVGSLTSTPGPGWPNSRAWMCSAGWSSATTAGSPRSPG